MKQPDDDLNLVGMTEEAAVHAATEAGRKVRVVRQDGKPMVVTRDYLPARFNLTVVDGVVTAVHMG
jgi:hypothetical protein